MSKTIQCPLCGKTLYPKVTPWREHVGNGFVSWYCNSKNCKLVVTKGIRRGEEKDWPPCTK